MTPIRGEGVTIWPILNNVGLVIFELWVPLNQLYSPDHLFFYIFLGRVPVLFVE